jgi:chondroitin AC lyase
MFCFGAGISAAKKNQVITNINQCFSSGEVMVRDNGKPVSVNATELSSPGISSVWHDGVGYYFPAGGEITVKNMEQTGSWYNINNSMPKDLVTHKVFSAWIGHGNSPASAGYQYAVVPSATQEVFEKWIASNPIRVISNTKDLQAISDKNSGLYGISFYKEGTVELQKGLTLSVDKPCLVLIGKSNSGKGLRISVADPTHMLTAITLKISKKLNGKGAIPDTGQSTSINVVLPSGDEAGKTTTEVYLNN